MFHRFDVLWTPSVLVLDPATGAERWRLEGYLPKPEFMAQLELALARIAFMHKQWAEAERRYNDIALNRAQTTAAPEAIYWRAVAHYKATNDHTGLGSLPGLLTGPYADSIWARKAIPFGG